MRKSIGHEVHPARLHFVAHLEFNAAVGRKRLAGVGDNDACRVRRGCVGSLNAIGKGYIGGLVGGRLIHHAAAGAGALGHVIAGAWRMHRIHLAGRHSGLCVVVRPGPVLAGGHSQKPARSQRDGIAEVESLLMNDAGNVEAEFACVRLIAGVCSDQRVGDVGMANGRSCQARTRIARPALHSQQ